MNIRIIAGKFGGRTIDAPKNKRTHPMGERVRSAMFNSLGDLLVGADVLDAYAGTGSIGLEAISRGASSALLIERDNLAYRILVKNIENLDANSAKAIRAGVAAWSDNNQATQFDLIFADPPYHDSQFSTIKKLMKHLKPGATMVLSHPGRGELPTETGVVVVDNRSYGNAVLTFYRREN